MLIAQSETITFNLCA